MRNLSRCGEIWIRISSTTALQDADKQKLNRIGFPDQIERDPHQLAINQSVLQHDRAIQAKLLSPLLA